MATRARPHRPRIRTATEGNTSGKILDATGAELDDEMADDEAYGDDGLADLFPPPVHDPFDSLRSKRVAYQAVLDLLHGFATTVCIARCLAGTEQHVDLAGLNETAGLLCARALDLRPEHGRQFALRLRSVLDDLDALHTILTPNAHEPPISSV